MKIALSIPGYFGTLSGLNVPANVKLCGSEQFLNLLSGKSHENRISCFSFIVGCFGHDALGGA